MSDKSPFVQVSHQQILGEGCFPPLTKGGWGVQNVGKYADVLLECSLTLTHIYKRACLVVLVPKDSVTLITLGTPCSTLNQLFRVLHLHDHCLAERFGQGGLLEYLCVHLYPDSLPCTKKYMRMRMVLMKIMTNL